MQVKGIIEFDKEIKQNNYLEVTNPIYFINGSNPSDDGLFSYKIFGRPGSKEREENWGYIDLHKRFLHPSAFEMFKSMSKDLTDLILSKRFFKLLEDGTLVEDNEDGRTGIDFLYEIYNKLVIEQTGTNSRAKRIELKNNLKVNEIFITKWLVCPAYLRDFNPGSSGKSPTSDEINKLYARLLILTKSIKLRNSSFDSMNINNLITESSIQLVLNQIHDYFLVDKMSGKTGHIHQALLGRTVDYSTRSVISCPNFMSNTYTEQEIPFGYVGVPLTQLVVLFYPFYVNFIQNFIAQHEMDIKLIKGSKSKQENVPTNTVLKDLFDEDLIRKLLSLFVSTEEYRFQKLRVEDLNGQVYQLEMFKEELGRDFTLMDLIYLATYEIVEDKHVYITRYPIENRNNIFPAKIKILSTRKTEQKTINNTYFHNYPHIIPDYPCDTNDLIMTVVPNNSYLSIIGGDYDGDQASLRSVFSKEANEEAERIINSKINLLDQDGSLMRSVGNEAVQSLYTLTMD